MSYALITVVLLVVDQLIKNRVVSQIVEHEVISIINGLLSFTYIKNYGIAFGMFQNKVTFFAIATGIIALVIMYMIIQFKNQHLGVTLCLVSILGGALGNLIDRVRLGYVIDYISVSFFPPIFNFADCCVVCGSIGLCLFILFDKKLLEEEKK